MHAKNVPETLASTIMSARDRESLAPRLSKLGNVGRRVLPITRGIFTLDFADYRRDWTLDVEVRKRVHDGYDAQLAVHSDAAVEARYRVFQDLEGLWTLGRKLEGPAAAPKLCHELRRHLARISVPRKGLKLYIVTLSLSDEPTPPTYRLPATSEYEAATKAVKGHYGGESVWVPPAPGANVGQVLQMVPRFDGGFAPRAIPEGLALTVTQQQRRRTHERGLEPAGPAAQAHVPQLIQ